MTKENEAQWEKEQNIGPRIGNTYLEGFSLVVCDATPTPALTNAHHHHRLVGQRRTYEEKENIR